eukprot:Filipodium_phascolosomae@DN5984_c0_g2_i1.p1
MGNRPTADFGPVDFHRDSSRRRSATMQTQPTVLIITNDSNNSSGMQRAQTMASSVPSSPPSLRVVTPGTVTAAVNKPPLRVAADPLQAFPHTVRPSLRPAPSAPVPAGGPAGRGTGGLLSPPMAFAPTAGW